MICRTNNHDIMSLNPTFGSHAAVLMRVRPALRLGGGRRVEREGRAAVEDGGRNRAARAAGATRAGINVGIISPTRPDHFELTKFSKCWKHNVLNS